LTGHAAGQDVAPVLDHATVVKAIGAGGAPVQPEPATSDLPEPLASVVEYLGDELEPDGREFVPTAELVEALDVEPTVFGRQMAELGCRPTRNRVVDDVGGVRRVRGYLMAEIRAAVDRGVDEISSSAGLR
jgi:S-DNA-T family DNA segregation ATPase FtsK/SpoIIIE